MYHWANPGGQPSDIVRQNTASPHCNLKLLSEPDQNAYDYSNSTPEVTLAFILQLQEIRLCHIKTSTAHGEGDHSFYGNYSLLILLD